MALGGVAMGSMKAQEALMVAGIMTKRGSMPTAVEVAARIGSNSDVMAVLLVTSVRNVITKQTSATITRGASLPTTGLSPKPTAAARPVL